MRLYILSKFKIQAINGPSDFTADDLVDIITDSNTRVIDDEKVANELFYTDVNCKYKYVLDVSLDKIKEKVAI
jgi:hypothetical protein